ncbi:hypothetical protein PHYSODRAFT_307102 [Phytophthora sojae]|uniref:Helitron helicase-like domain-containing protein n=1 Tax=Phytophthora sojae (strain P6497) TaxID=1094619 RepID=G5ACM6_PHYSP|nr:hypothetical protein PHYSODRAFT_307102 [Phytophthora sojae]EGZ07100.1 hypothetical protein PHYSODRAFT_307102 [Phytophthora sojae]|eukprot:XP_009537864.1 hypothetical protein PHYSODRAFT_307102 [Phytophthora sojae]
MLSLGIKHWTLYIFEQNLLLILHKCGYGNTRRTFGSFGDNEGTPDVSARKWLWGCKRTKLCNECKRADSRPDKFAVNAACTWPTGGFFTISPSSSTTYRIANLAGVIPRDLLDLMETEVAEHLEYTRAKLGMVATANPVSYFDHVMNVVISVLLNWDRDTNAPKPGCGIFGEVTAFYGSTESQSSTGDLHCHMMVWVAGFPKTVTEYINMCKSAAFKQKLIDYVNSVVTTDVPVQYDETCPECGCNGLEAVEFDQRAYQEQFGGNEVITDCVEREISRLDFPAGAVSEGAAFTRTASSKPFVLSGERSNSDDILHTRSLLSFQSHHWYHSGGCFKHTKRTPTAKVCRMYFPKVICDEIKWTPSDCVELARKLWNEYINAHVPVISKTLKCNHDVKLLAAGEGLHKSFYMMKCCAKPQRDIENPAALRLHAYDKAEMNA